MDYRKLPCFTGCFARQCSSPPKPATRLRLTRPSCLARVQQQMDVVGRMIRLSPGMTVPAEIKTGQRRIEYLLSPIQRAGSESLRER
jgi:hypothetical protein